MVHGIPNAETILEEGDIISIDCGTLLNGFNGDSCYTFCVGEVAVDVKKLLEVTKTSLYKAIDTAQAGKHLGDVGAAVQDYCEFFGYGIVRELKAYNDVTLRHDVTGNLSAMQQLVERYFHCG